MILKTLIDDLCLDQLDGADEDFLLKRLGERITYSSSGEMEIYDDKSQLVVKLEYCKNGKVKNVKKGSGFTEDKKTNLKQDIQTITNEKDQYSIGSKVFLN